MTYHIYFINLDDNIVKFGITSNILQRINTHYSKFVNKLKLNYQLQIVRIIECDKNILIIETEKRLKKYLKYSNNNLKKYDETELFYIKDIDYYMNKINSFIENIIKEFELDKNSYIELSSDTIKNIYNKSIKDKAKYDNNILDLENIMYKYYYKMEEHNDELIEKSLVTDSEINRFEDNIISCKINLNFLKNEFICSIKEDDIRIKKDLTNKLDILSSKLEYKLLSYNLQNNTRTKWKGIDHIYNYGQESIINLTSYDWEDIFNSNFNMIVKYIQFRHIRTPQNRNIYYDACCEEMHILDNQVWVIICEEDLLNQLFNNSIIILQKIIDKFGNKFQNASKTKSQTILDCFNYDCVHDYENVNKIKLEIKKLIQTNIMLIENTYETAYDKPFPKCQYSFS